MPTRRQEPTGDPATPPGATTEDAAAFLVGKMVRNAADATAEWLQDGATAFETSLQQAVKGCYSSDQLAKDLAGAWTRHLTLFAKLVVASQPEATGRPSSGGQRPGATGSPGGQEPSAGGSSDAV